MTSLWFAFRQTSKLLGSHHKLWIPFLVVAFVELFLLGLVWLAPHPPFSKLLAPPIRYFFGDRIFHYPWHLWFLYQAMKHTHLIALTLVGAFFTGVACVMVRQTHEQVPLSLRTALVNRKVRYGVVLLLWVITVGLAKGVAELLVHVLPKAAWGGWVLMGSMVVVQTLLIYAIPAAVFNGSTWWRALSQGIRETLRHPVTSFVVVALPTAAVLLFSLAAPPARVAQWTARSMPEITFAFVAARLVIWTLTDAIMTVSVAHLWWIHRAPQRVVAPSVASTVAPARFQEGPVVA